MRVNVVRDPGASSVVRGQRAVCSTDNTIVTDTVLRVLRDGGNAFDAAVAACIVQATVEPFMTNHAGTVCFLGYEAKTGIVHALNSHGTIPAHLPLFQPVPPLAGGFYSTPGFQPSGCIPGFMPGLKAIYERFCTKPWGYLVDEAIGWAEDGHIVSSFEHQVYIETLPFCAYFPDGQDFFMPGGFVPAVGSRMRNLPLAQTLRALAAEGPEYFISGEWARRFVAKANAMGWAIGLDDLSVSPPFEEPLRYRHRDLELVHLPLPQEAGLMSMLVLGVVANVQGASGPLDSPNAVRTMAMALRLALQQCGYLNDPLHFAVPLDTWSDPAFHRHLASIVANSLPAVDLTSHVEKTWGKARLTAAGLPHERAEPPKQPSGSCELAIVDADGNWVEMMNTLQSGGIPGMVLDGVPMVGSHASPGSLASWIDTWLTPGCRMRSAIGNTMALRDGKPVFSLGTPGIPHVTVPQVLTNIIERKMDYPAAAEAPRMLGIADDYSLTVENRLSADTKRGLTALGIKLNSAYVFDFHMGSFQIAWRDEDGTLGASADPRRCGIAGGIA